VYVEEVSEPVEELESVEELDSSVVVVEVR